MSVTFPMESRFIKRTPPLAYTFTFDVEYPSNKVAHTRGCLEFIERRSSSHDPTGILFAVVFPTYPWADPSPPAATSS
eukprot:435888-Rhodomonas_salina.2